MSDYEELMLLLLVVAWLVTGTYPWFVQRAYARGRADGIKEALTATRAEVSEVAVDLRAMRRRLENATAQDIRGTFAPPSNREEIFSQDVEFRIRDLPRWKPQITILDRELEDDG